MAVACGMWVGGGVMVDVHRVYQQEDHFEVVVKDVKSISLPPSLFLSLHGVTVSFREGDRREYPLCAVILSCRKGQISGPEEAGATLPDRSHKEQAFHEYLQLG